MYVMYVFYFQNWLASLSKMSQFSWKLLLFRPAILDDELLVGTGMAAALKAASQMGYIEKSQTKAKSSGLQELKAQKFSIEDKSRYILNSTDVYVY